MTEENRCEGVISQDFKLKETDEKKTFHQRIKAN